MLEERFNRLVDWWWDDIRYESSLDNMTNHPAYLQIIDMGLNAIPMIMKVLKDKPYLYIALQKITGNNPISETLYGDIDAIVNAWIDWYGTTAL